MDLVGGAVTNACETAAAVATANIMSAATDSLQVAQRTVILASPVIAATADLRNCERS